MRESDERDRYIIQFLNTIMYEAHEIAVKNGFWDVKRNNGELIALMHSELSEALEAIRSGWPKDEHLPDMDSATVELADCIIRIMDFAAARGLYLSEAIINKMEFNESRPYKHGKKF